MKEFDSWNEIKKNIDTNKKNRRYHSGDVWWCSLGKNIGYEENGKGISFERPVLVIKGFSKQVCLIVPLNTTRKYGKFYSFLGKINGRDNYAILSHVRLIDSKRFVNQIGFINSNKLEAIKKAICILIR